MVCTFGRGRMACMARLLEAGEFPEKSPEEAIHDRIDIQTIYMQFYDADEPNLLEEKDMHVFDSRPLTDPLHLVCCNACEKPVRASQFTAHSERCKSINPKDAVCELDGGCDKKKPPKKGRKRIQATNGREKQIAERACGNNFAAPKLNLDNQNGMLHSLPKENQTSVDPGIIPDASAAGHGGINYPDVPRPLATKIYHSQQSHRLRMALDHLYQRTSVEENGNNSVSVELKQDTTMVPSQAPFANSLLYEIHKDDGPQMKEDCHNLSDYQTNSRRTGF